MAKEFPGNTLTPTALVHEVYLRLNDEDKEWDSEAHIFGAAANSMRQILIERARSKLSQKRGGSFNKLDFETAELSLDLCPRRAQLVLDLDQSLKMFAREFPVEANIVNLRFFGGLTMDEIAEILELSRRTIQRHWAFAKGKLSQLMNTSE